MVATDWKTITHDAPADLVPAGYSISGVFDLATLTQISVNTDLKLDEKSARACSPLFWRVPAGRSFDAAVGALKSSEFLRQSRTVAETWRQAKAQTRYEEIAGTNHFTVVEALVDPRNAMVARIAELAGRVGR